jgi:hypothetical protein
LTGDKNLPRTLRSIAIKLGMSTYTNAEFYMDMTPKELGEICEDIKEAQKKHGKR